MSRFGATSTAEEVSEGISLRGRAFVVTGCNSGLGLETARVLAMRGAHVIGLARTEDKARHALSGLKLGKSATVTGLECELSEPESIRVCADSILALETPLSVLVLNAGIMALPERQEAHGFERQYFVNHLAHALLFRLLEPQLADDARVVCVSSGAHRRAPKSGIDFDNLDGEQDYDGWKMYGQSKLANILFAKALSRRWHASKRTVNALHPGVIRTGLTRHMRDAGAAALSGAQLKSVPQGAATQVSLAVRHEHRATSGMYFSNCQFAKPSANARDTDLAEALWAHTEDVIQRL